MPELPEVETVRLTLAPAIGAKVASTWTSGLPLRLNQPVPAVAIEAAAAGRRIEDVRRVGKYLLIDFAAGPRSLLVHLGMSGRLRLMSAASPLPPHTHVILTLGGRPRRELRFSDPRRFGVVDLVERGRERDHPALARLGVDPLVGELTGDLLYDATRGLRRAIKLVLLDQHVIAGVGNIYASEALWRARVRPTLAAGRLSRPRALVLAEAVREVLAHALDHGGTSLRDFVNADGHEGQHAHYLHVYDRAGEVCVRPGCGRVIRRTVLQGRVTFHCPGCQVR
ncbi:bifunctional DNA-formamidopyrimidine glycosylase/DNA-(apurinic or apyrimidinic site) lyase [Haliangium sp.]|uniref:bifunctional DNA-formamidopyrimidine glycosylase/DNA-(apurinic or apyrimidinic site) lyase n=1 Tax=Haliangium sp. TaxID=2663208 RepID=UPI003D0C86BC